MNKRLITVTLFAVISVITSAAVYAQQQYTLYYSGEIRGYVTITQDTRGKVTIIPKITKDLDTLNYITHKECPIIPQGQMLRVDPYVMSVVIDGNTITETRTGGTVTKSVINGNTTTTTFSGGGWIKSIVEGNTTIIARDNGEWRKIVVNGNTITETWSDGRLIKSVISGNITTSTWVSITSISMWIKTVVDKQGYNIYIHTTASHSSFGL